MCIFCEIVNGNIPSSKIYEDDDFIGILDISQTTKGHSLLIPKKHYDNVLLMPNDLQANLFKQACKLGSEIKSKLNATGINFLVNTEPSAGQSVMHAHLHLIPRYDGNDGIKIEFSENKFDLQEIKDIITK